MKKHVVGIALLLVFASCLPLAAGTFSFIYYPRPTEWLDQYSQIGTALRNLIAQLDDYAATVITTYVPYTGATTNVNLGTKTITSTAAVGFVGTASVAVNAAHATTADSATGATYWAGFGFPLATGAGYFYYDNMLMTLRTQLVDYAQTSDTATVALNLSNANWTDLTDAGASILHYHASDRDSANWTGTNAVDLTDGGTTTLHSHAGGGGTPGGAYGNVQYKTGTTFGAEAAFTYDSSENKLTTDVYNMPTTSATAGQIRVNNVTQFHCYGTRNYFSGGSGNYTLTGTDTWGGGYGALASVTSGSYNWAAGSNALDAITDGSYNIGIGRDAGGNATDSYCTYIGTNAGLGFTKGGSIGYNIAIGTSAAETIAAVSVNDIFIGYRTGYGSAGGTTASNNIGIGTRVMEDIKHGDANTVIGDLAGVDISDAYYVTAIGDYAAYKLTGASNTGYANAFFGSHSGYSMLTGHENFFGGAYSGYNSTGDHSTLVGYYGGRYLSSGSGNVTLGYSAGPTGAQTYSDRLYIDNSANDTPLIGGDFSANEIWLNIADAGAYTLQVGGTGYFTGAITAPNFTGLASSATTATVVSNTGDITYTTDSGGASTHDHIFYNGATGIAEINEAGRLQLDDDLIVSGCDVTNNASAAMRFGNSEGTFTYDGDNMSGIVDLTATGTMNLAGIWVSGTTIQEVATNGNAAIYFNYNGYNNGTTQFRDFYIDDGKQAMVAWFDGSSGYVYNQDNTTTWNQTCDAKIKRNIRPTKYSGIDTIMKLKIRDFERECNGETRTGLVAQEVAEVFPGMQKTAPYKFRDGHTEEVMAIGSEPIREVTIKAIQEQQAIIEAQQKRLDDLEQRIVRMEGR